MKAFENRLASSIKTLFRVCALLVLACSIAQADTNFEEVVETMMHTAADDALFIEAAFGEDPATTLHFSSNVDTGAMTFSFSLLPSQTYQGQSIGLSLSGSYNSGLAQYDLTGNGYLGTNTWTESGSMAWEGDPFVTIKSKWEVCPLCPYQTLSIYYSVEGKVWVEPNDPDQVSSGRVTFTESGGLPGDLPQEVFEADILDRRTKDGWAVSTILTNYSNKTSSASGFTPYHDSGSGYFDVVIVPEPSTLVLASGGVTLLAWLRRRKRRRE